MTLDEFFQIAEESETQAITDLSVHPYLVKAIEVAGDYQEGQPASAILHAAHRGLSRLVAALIDGGADIESRGLGITFSKSSSITRPNPSQLSHAPKGL